MNKPQTMQEVALNAAAADVFGLMAFEDKGEKFVEELRNLPDAALNKMGTLSGVSEHQHGQQYIKQLEHPLHNQISFEDESSTFLKEAPNALVREEALVVQHRAILRASTSDNTRRAYQSAVRHFLSWGGVLPAFEDSVISYLLTYAESLNPRTLAVRLTALSQWHLQQGFSDPTSTQTVRKTLVGIERLHGKPKKKARALILEDLERISVVLRNLDTLKAKRDNALLQMAYFGGYRRSEIVSLQISNVAWVPEGIIITLPRSKTDQKGQGVIKAIPYGHGPCCPANALSIWLKATSIASGFLFRSVNKWGKISTHALYEGSINSILKDCAKLIQLDYSPQLTSHSLRRGMATSAYRAGADFRDIKRQGGWRHDATVQGYIDDADQFEANAVLRLLRKS